MTKTTCYKLEGNQYGMCVLGDVYDNVVLQIMEELGENGLRIYTFPTEDATVAEINNKMNVSASNVYCGMNMLTGLQANVHRIFYGIFSVPTG